MDKARAELQQNIEKTQKTGAGEKSFEEETDAPEAEPGF